MLIGWKRTVHWPPFVVFYADIDEYEWDVNYICDEWIRTSVSIGRWSVRRLSANCATALSFPRVAADSDYVRPPWRTDSRYLEKEKKETVVHPDKWLCKFWEKNINIPYTFFFAHSRILTVCQRTRRSITQSGQIVFIFDKKFCGFVLQVGNYKMNTQSNLSSYRVLTLFYTSNDPCWEYSMWTSSHCIVSVVAKNASTNY